MSSLKQIAANRRNALHSTGPRTPEGKLGSRANALRHGLTAETVIVTHEDAEDYQAFEAAIIADHDAETALERELVLRLASVLWRLRRATSIETALFNRVANQIDESQPSYRGPTLVAGADAERADPSSAATDRRSELIGEPVLDCRRQIAEAFLHLATLPTCPLDRLSRYEYLLWRQARQLTLTLHSLHYRRRVPRRPSFPFAFRGIAK